jgi:succinyl-CoA synthetase beta subunit
MRKLKEILIRRDGMNEQEAEELIDEAKEQFQTYLEAGDITSAYDICEEYFGLEPDYLDFFI